MIPINQIKEDVTIDPNLGGDFKAFVANERCQYIENNLATAIKNQTITSNKLSRSDKIDKVLTNKVLGIPIFLLFMLVVFHLTFGENLFFITEIPSPGVWLQGLTEELIGFISESVGTLLENLNAADWVMGLVVDGLIAGVGAVLSFLPQILMLFLFLSIMEDTGYMARVAFIMDRILRRFGLSGKAFMPSQWDLGVQFQQLWEREH
ncbi:hypothetical protein AZF37_03085 [endosymbiont 'TC1' of Trimyema compressum]|uniref:nucleoside recognition domain-containing protein n=1 Tax=endosymbiont 'TC1' of Trimyema compressum TaxID=243899 RepID=UPI0007F0FBE0|nr:nucleoside recognition domain-containing protein [endosymbiont 'TC1' of Trimyema compressum]AMP20286.1 hypothetical protein AZF37_03085 [endosymbiont 'TC1' of Trimyema compressum]